MSQTLQCPHCGELEPLMTVDQVAAYMDFHPKQVYRIISRKQLAPVMRTGNRIKIPVSTVRAYIREHIPSAEQ